MIFIICRSNLCWGLLLFTVLVLAFIFKAPLKNFCAIICNKILHHFSTNGQKLNELSHHIVHHVNKKTSQTCNFLFEKLSAFVILTSSYTRNLRKVTLDCCATPCSLLASLSQTCFTTFKQRTYILACNLQRTVMTPARFIGKIINDERIRQTNALISESQQQQIAEGSQRALWTWLRYIDQQRARE